MQKSGNFGRKNKIQNQLFPSRPGDWKPKKTHSFSAFLKEKFTTQK
jgi:hypothetical protein